MENWANFVLFSRITKYAAQQCVTVCGLEADTFLRFYFFKGQVIFP